MSAKPETTFIASVHKHLTPGRKNPYWMKNSNDYTSGIADCWYSGSQADLWIEYKFLVLPKREATLIVPGLSALQIEWCGARYDEGRNVAVIVGCKEGGVIFHDKSWEEPISTSNFKLGLLSRRELAEWIEHQTNS